MHHILLVSLTGENINSVRRKDRDTLSYHNTMQDIMAINGIRQNGIKSQVNKRPRLT